MKYLLVITLCAVAAWGAAAEILTFYGYVTDGKRPMFNARVEVRCNCMWKEIKHTDEKGYYEFYAGTHEGHRGSIEAEAEGYLGVCYNIDAFGPPPTRYDFELIEYNASIAPASLGKVRALYK